MPKYTVCLAVYAEKYIEVDAENEEDAKDKAADSDENEFSLCHHCSSEFELANHAGEPITVELTT